MGHVSVERMELKGVSEVIEVTPGELTLHVYARDGILFDGKEIDPPLVIFFDQSDEKEIELVLMPDELRPLARALDRAFRVLKLENLV